MPPAQAAAPPQQKRRRRRRRPGDEEEPVLRTTCDACTSAKVKCNGEKPCMRCGNKNIQCEYTFKKRCGPKRRKNVPGDSGGLLAPYPAGAAAGVGAGGKLLGFDDHLRGESTALNKDEVECVDVFMQNINSFLPLTTMGAVKRAATAAPPYMGDGRGTEGSGDDDGCGGSGGDTPDEERDQVYHARKAMLHGAIALGAQLLEKDEASLPHSSIAREEIKECFDAALPELVASHLILALYWTLHMDSTKITRYIGLAHQSKGIIGDPPGALAASLTFVSVMLYDAKVVGSIGCRVEPPGSANKAGIPSAKNPAACQERVLNILSYVLLAIHNHSYGSGSSSSAAAAAVAAVGMGTCTGEWNPKALTEHVYEAKALLDEGAVGGGPNDISRCIVVVLQAYFLLLTDSRRQAIVITEPLADLVTDNPLVLHVPIVWSLIGCVRVLLDQANRTIAVERLQTAMEPLAAHRGFSTNASLVEQELMRVFEGKPTVTIKRKGATTALSAAGAAASAAATAAAAAAAVGTVEAEDVPVSANALMRHSRAQTSSLNVTAQDYSHRGRSPIDLLALEPSPAPRRRSLPQSSARNQGASRGGGGGGVSPSLLSAAMVSSGEPLLASSPPPSRAGALTRAPATRGSLLSVSAPFVQVKPPPATLPLEIPFMGGGFGEEAFTAAGEGTVMSNRVKEEQMVVRAEAGGGPAGGGEREVLLAAGGSGGGGGGGKEVEGDRPQLMRRQRAQQASFTPDAPVPSLEGMAAELEGDEDEDGRQQSFKADAPLPQEDGAKLDGDRRELMAKQQVQQSFVADAPVSLEQVESNMARLGVSHLSSSQGEDASGLSRLVTSMDLDAAAELLATRQTNFIS
ncbi:unnamed protein product [Scytosiphon promiscuus]